MIAAKSAFRMMSPWARNISPGIMVPSSANGSVDCDQFHTVRERGLHLHIVQHFRDSLHHVIAADYMRAFFHEVGDAAPISGAFHDRIGNQRDSLGIIEFDAAAKAPPGD